MSVIFSRQCEYALQAILLLAQKKEGSTMSIRELARRLGIPYHFLAKIFQDLTHKGLLKSSRGPNGGFSLAKPASKITLQQIITAIDGDHLVQDCVLGLDKCSSDHPCAFHESWLSARQGLSVFLTKEHLDHMTDPRRKLEHRGR